MNSYEVDQKLRGKVDAWEHHALQQKVSSLENEVNSLEREVDNLDSRIANQYTVIQELLGILINKPEFEEVSNSLQNLKNIY